MSYPPCTEDLVDFFEVHGFLVVDGALDREDVAEIDQRCKVIVENKQRLAFDWAWEKGTDIENRAFRVVQGDPTAALEGIETKRLRSWTVEFASRLMRRPMEIWYDQFLGKPPRDGAPVYWHQDEAYWGRNLDDRGITCWIPLQDVDESNGCMHFIERGHRDGILSHHQPEHIQSDLLRCAPDLSRAVACPMKVGGVTFHHSKTPHMTTANHSGAWRNAISTHMRVQGTLGEGDHYPWKVYVNQRTGERRIPPSR